MGGTGGTSLHGAPASTCHRRVLRSRAGALGPLQGGWACLPGPWLPWRTLDVRLGRGGPRLSSSPVFTSLSLHIQRVGTVVGPLVGPDGSPGQEAQWAGSWGLTLPTSACSLAPEQRGEGPVFPSSCPCRPSSPPIPSAGLTWGLTFPGHCFVSWRRSSEGESTAWLPPP